MDLFQTIRESHQIQRELARKLVRAKDAATREPLFLQLRVELHAHAAAEERYLYVPLLMTDGGLEVSRHALAEHHDIDECLEKATTPKKSGAGWEKNVKKLSEEVHHHLKEEESKFFKVAGRLLDDKQKERLAGQYQRNLVKMRKTYAEDFASVTVGASGKVKPADQAKARDPRLTTAKDARRRAAVAKKKDA